MLSCSYISRKHIKMSEIMNKTKVNECVFKWCLNVWVKQDDLKETFGVAKEIGTMIMDFYGPHFKCHQCVKWSWGTSTIKCSWYANCGAVFCWDCRDCGAIQCRHCINEICSKHRYVDPIFGYMLCKVCYYKEDDDEYGYVLYDEYGYPVMNYDQGSLYDQHDVLYDADGNQY